MRLYQVWLGSYEEPHVLVLKFRSIPHRLVWDKFVRYRSMISAPWGEGLRLTSKSDCSLDTMEWPDETTFLHHCFRAKKNLESFKEMFYKEPQDET